MAQRVLVFESDADFAGQVQAAFARHDATVEVVADGNEGLLSAANAPPDLILLSIELPSMNGFLVCKKIKKNKALKNIPLMILSSDSNAEEIFEQHKKLRTRAEDYVRKPVSMDDLLTRAGELVTLPPASEAAPPMAATEEVDQEIDDFAEGAFDAMMIEEVVDEELQLDEISDPTNVVDVNTVQPPESIPPISIAPESIAPESIAPESIAPEVLEMESEPPTSKVPSLPPASMPAVPMTPAVPSARPAPPIPKMDAPSSALDSERVKELEDALRAATAQATKAEELQRELQTLKSRPPKSSGISSREFLDLREELNKKDKELLDLRDQLSSRDKQLLDLRDKNLALERLKADLDDSIAESEHRLSEASEKNTQLTGDVASATKRFDDLKVRFERSEQKSTKLSVQLEEAIASHASAQEESQAEHATALAAAAATLAAQKEAAQSELEAKLTEAEEANKAAQSVLTENFEGKKAEIEATKAAALADMKQQLEQGETSHAAALAKAEEEHGKQLALLGRKLAEAEGSIAEHLSTVSALTETKTALDKQLSESQSATTRAEATVAELTAKVEADSAILERVEKALSVGLGLLEQQKNNAVAGE